MVLGKTHVSYSVEYWFRCIDIDGDGILSLYELEHFYEEMIDKMIILGIESLSVEDYMCQVSSGYHGDDDIITTLPCTASGHDTPNRRRYVMTCIQEYIIRERVS